MLTEGLSIFGVFLLSAGLQAINNYKKHLGEQRSFRSLQSSKSFRIRRDGQAQLVDSSQLVVGDVVDFEEGVEIPADAILLEGEGVQADEASMTGETDPLGKQTFHDCLARRDHVRKSGELARTINFPSPVLISGSTIYRGAGKMLVIAVGEKSMNGKIKRHLTSTDPDRSPLLSKKTWHK